MTQEKIRCKDCGSSFFSQEKADQYFGGGYGTAEYRAVSGSPKIVLVCIGCGTPITPQPSYHARGSLSSLAEADFNKSVEVGQKYRKDNSIQNVANVAASIQELRAIQVQVAGLVQIVESLKTMIESLPKPKAKNIKEVAHVGTPA